jgi:hypothetical protein
MRMALDPEKRELPLIQVFFDCSSHAVRQGTPSCAICRTRLSVDVPMIPNFAVDNAVEKHVHALRIGGIEGWEKDGSKFAEWQGRKA